MKVRCPPGFRTDLPPTAPAPFWYYGENVRFRLGIPETVGLFTKLYRNDEHVQIPIEDGIADVYADRNLVVFGSGQKVVFLRWKLGELVAFDTPDAGSSGRWWFTSTEDTIICGRTNFTGKTYAFTRAPLTLTLLPNAPDGGMGAGIVGGILVKAGTVGVAGDGPELVVRWSARRTDASSSGGPGGPFGFEDWTPSDLNSSGEFLLDEGSQVVGGTATPFGFVAWTDTRTYLLRPRPDSYVFTLSKIAQRGLLSPRAFGTADSRLWWWDSTRTLNVYDGGGVRQVPNPMRHMTIDRMADDDVFDQCSVSTSPEYGEVILHYPDQSGATRELVYNYIEDAWYVFRLNRIAVTDEEGERASIAIHSDGRLYFHDVREPLAFDLDVPPHLSPPDPVFTEVQPEPFDFFLMTNRFAPENLAMQSMRSRNAVVSYTAAQLRLQPAISDTLSLSMRSWGSLDLRDTGYTDTQSRALGEQLFPMRLGGKTMQLCLHGSSFRSLIRVGDIDLEAEPGGEK